MQGGHTLQSVISLCTRVTNQAKEIKHLKAQIKKLKKKAKPVITHHRAWMKSVSLKQRLTGKKSLKKNWMQKESVSKQGRKSCQTEPSVHKDPLFDELPDDTLDYIRFIANYFIAGNLKMVVKSIISQRIPEFIMALPQRQADVHQDELCKPNKRYALMDANKKIDLDNPLYPNESKIMFSEMVPFFLNTLGFTLDLRLPSNFKTTGLVQPWQRLGKIYARCLTTRVTSHDQPPLQIMQMLYCFVNNIHVDYAEALWEGLHYALEHLSTQIPYPSFTKLIIGHYMTVFPEISRRARDKHHNLEDDALVKNIFNSWKHKDSVGMKTSKEIEKVVEGAENVEIGEVDSSTLRQNDNPIIPDTRLEPKSNKESPEVEITDGKQPVNVIEEEEESPEDDYELRIREKGKHVEESRSTPSFTKIRSPRTHSTLVSSDTKKLQELMVSNPPPSSSTPSSFSSKSNITATNRLLSLLKPNPGHFKRYMSFFDELQG
ncbi:hypothetical protein Tco_1029836 [Tanacetum coccineum]|uniref:Uncharacterized protein n=1 Tax=Tanacetum coccineum TaxID=301880 RepID=A0ABQ5G4I5_9ASTR